MNVFLAAQSTIEPNQLALVNLPVFPISSICIIIFAAYLSRQNSVVSLREHKYRTVNQVFAWKQ